MKIGHQVGLGYKVQGSRFKVKRFALFFLTIDSIGLITWRINSEPLNREPLNREPLNPTLGRETAFFCLILHHNTL